MTGYGRVTPVRYVAEDIILKELPLEIRSGPSSALRGPGEAVHGNLWLVEICLNKSEDQEMFTFGPAVSRTPESQTDGPGAGDD